MEKSLSGVPPTVDPRTGLRRIDLGNRIGDWGRWWIADGHLALGWHGLRDDEVSFYLSLSGVATWLGSPRLDKVVRCGLPLLDPRRCPLSISVFVFLPPALSTRPPFRTARSPHGTPNRERSVPRLDVLIRGKKLPSLGPRHKSYPNLSSVIQFLFHLLIVK